MAKKKKNKTTKYNFSDNITTNLNEFKINKEFKNILTGYIKENKSIEIGIDEAGRGPVIGPLVYGLVIFPTEKSENEILEDNSAKRQKKENFVLKDSKKMAVSSRLNSDFHLQKEFPCAKYILHPMFISTEMDRNSLNIICMYAVQELLSEVEKIIFEIQNSKSKNTGIRKLTDSNKKNKISELKISIFIDSLGNGDGPISFMNSIFPKYKFTIKPKADSIYKIVSAASIVAKVERDMLLECIISNHCFNGCNPIKEQLGGYFKDDESVKNSKLIQNGSVTDLSNIIGCNGYPSDEKSRIYLKSFPDCQFIRFKWSTYTEMFIKGED